jgi:DNA-directed RNA polymerase specialized sigma24 family protein
MLRLLRRALATLEHQERRALVLRFGPDGDRERSYRTIARDLRCSDHSARVLVERAQRHLRAAIG